jgi:WYL domain
MADITILLCEAIRERRVVRLLYGASASEYREVEPHIIGYNRRDKLTLGAWFLAGASTCQQGEGWREYLISEIRSLTVLDRCFAKARKGYKPDGGANFHGVQCAL